MHKGTNEVGEVNLPDQGKQKYYDIAPLQAFLEAGFTVLTPNFRLARSIGVAWSQSQQGKGENVWRTPCIAPLEKWLQDQWQEAVRDGQLEPLVPASPGQQLELWQDVIAAHERSHKGYSLLRPTAAAAQASRARDTLLQWQVDFAQAHHRQEFSLDEDCATFLNWHTLFVEKLASLAMTTYPDCYTRLFALASDLGKTRLVLVGFDDIPPLLRSCVEALAEELVELESPGQPGTRTAFGYPDKRSELAAVARWAKELNDEYASPSIGIILPGMSEDRPALEYLLRREFDCLGSNYTSLPVNFSTGIPLDQVPMARDALTVLTMARPRVAVDDIVAVFQSRFVTLEDVDSARAVQFLHSLFDSGEEYIEAGDLRYKASRFEQPDGDGGGELAIARILMAIAANRDIRRNALPSVWAERFSGLLEIWGWPGRGPLDSIEYQQLKLWYALLEELASYDLVCPAMAFDEALQLLKRCCSRQVSQPQTPDSNIQVLGLLEAAGLGFDHLWICDMQAGIWPAPARPNPFIPIRLQRDMGMPNATAEREWSFASGLMSQYLHCADHVIASYAQQRDGVPENPSALLEGFQWQPAIKADIVDGHWLSVLNESQMESLEDSQAPVLQQAELSALGGGSGLLEDQSNCPFRAFALRRLNLHPLGERTIALSAAERGSLLHDALYHLWGAIGDSDTLAGMDDAAVDLAATEAVRAAVDSMPAYRRRNMGRAYYQLESQRLHNLMVEWLEVERQRSDFFVLAREEKISLQIEQLEISLRVDRIDQLPDGAQFIIDYKSGLSSPQDWLGDRPAKPQLMLYGIATQETVAGLAFAQVRSRSCKYTGAGQTGVAPGVQSDIEKLVKNKMSAKDWEDLTAQWQANLERLAREFVAGDARVDPLRDSSCTYCGLQALCRVGDNANRETQL